jgi:hypothetical protein
MTQEYFKNKILDLEKKLFQTTDCNKQDIYRTQIKLLTMGLNKLPKEQQVEKMCSVAEMIFG